MECLYGGGGGNVMEEAVLQNKAREGSGVEKRPLQKNTVNPIEKFDFILRATASPKEFYLGCGNQIYFLE